MQAGSVEPVMVEKDFWVSWTLAVLFTHPEFGGQLVFKGGTSLSKVYGVIGRFSEDIDLSVSPAFLGISEKTVKAHLTSVFRAIGVTDRTQAALWAERYPFEAGWDRL